MHTPVGQCANLLPAVYTLATLEGTSDVHLRFHSRIWNGIRFHAEDLNHCFKRVDGEISVGDPLLSLKQEL